LSYVVKEKIQSANEVAGCVPFRNEIPIRRARSRPGLQFKQHFGEAAIVFVASIV
jgi:hypothetical protein